MSPNVLAAAPDFIFITASSWAGSPNAVRAGYDVLFVEEGGYHPTPSFNPYLSESIPRLYRDAGGTVIIGRPPIPYAEGRCVGGGTVVNGGMTWRPPEEVLLEWEKLTGQPDLGPRTMEALFDRVEERVHAKPQHPASVGEDSRLLEEGAARLGWHYEPNRRAQDRPRSRRDLEAPVVERLAGRAVDHHAEGAVIAVFEHVHDRAVEVGVLQWRRRDEKTSLGGSAVGEHRSHSVAPGRNPQGAFDPTKEFG